MNNEYGPVRVLVEDVLRAHVCLKIAGTDTKLAAIRAAADALDAINAELLAACEAYVEQDDGSEDIYAGLLRVQAMIRAAIAKAHGLTE